MYTDKIYQKKADAHFYSNPYRLSALKCDCHPLMNYLMTIKYLYRWKVIQFVTKLNSEIAVNDKVDAEHKINFKLITLPIKIHERFIKSNYSTFTSHSTFINPASAAEDSAKSSKEISSNISFPSASDWVLEVVTQLKSQCEIRLNLLWCFVFYQTLKPKTSKTFRNLKIPYSTLRCIILTSHYVIIFID